MSVVTLARRNGRPIVLIGLDREDIDHLIGTDVVHLESVVSNLPDLAIFAGENEADLLKTLNEMMEDS
jgi:hypothetical protein